MDNVNGLALARIAIGAGFWAAPDKAMGAFGLQATRQTPYLGRMFGAREVALGAATLLSPPEHRRSVILMGLAVDVLDAAAGAMVAKTGAVSSARGAALTGAALAAAVTGLVGLSQARGAVPRP